MIGNPITQLEQLTINTKSKSFLKEIAKWTFFLSIIGFVGIAFMVILAVFSSVIFGAIPQAQQMPFDFSMMMTILYLVLAVLYYYQVIYLLKFSRKMKKALASKNNETFADALEMLKSHYKFIGVFTIITLSIYTMLIVVSLVSGSLL
jgi:hypothetical protein